MKLLREPLAHFLLLGAVLFGVFALVGDRGSARTGHRSTPPLPCPSCFSVRRSSAPGAATPASRSGIRGWWPSPLACCMASGLPAA
jgi:hypothetical protein